VSEQQLMVVEEAGVWCLRGPAVGEFALVNEFLAYLADRNFSPRTCRAYAYDLLAFARWLVGEDLALADVDVDVMLRFLTACREATPRGRPGGNVYSIRDGRNTGYAPATINRRLAAISSLFAFREMRDPGVHSPMPRGGAARLRAGGERTGLLAHVGKPKSRSKLGVREPRRLPCGLSREESSALLGSFRTWRDRAIGGLMLLSGLRSAEVLGLRVADVDVARRWVRVSGKGGKERSVPIDTDVAGAIQTYLLAERPETDSSSLFVVAKGPHRGRRSRRPGYARCFGITSNALG
jgi:site-specific recombinase XerD